MKLSFRTNAKPRQIINSRKIFYAFGISIILIFPSSCVPQQSDLARIQKDLELQIVQIKEEKMTLGLQVKEIRGQLIRVNEEAQKTRSNLASINQKTRLLQEKDVAGLYGKLEEAEKTINDLRKGFANQSGVPKYEFQSIQASIARQEEELQKTHEYFQGKLENLEQEIKNLKFDKVQLLPEEKQNQEARLRNVNPEAIRPSLLDFADKKKELLGYSRACFSNEWTIPLEYQTMTKNEAYFKINQLIARHENSALAWENCLGNLKEKLTGLRSHFNTNLKPFFSGFKSAEPKIENVMKLTEKSLNEAELFIEEAYPKVIQIQTNLSAYFKSLKYYEPTSEDSYLRIPEENERLEVEVFRFSRKQASSVLDDIKALYTLYPSEKNALRLSNMEILAGLYEGVNIFLEEDSRAYGQKSKDFQKEIDLTKFRTQQISNDPRIRRLDPGLVKDYEALLKDLQKLSDSFWSFKILVDPTLDSFQDQSGQSSDEKMKDALSQYSTLLEKLENALLLLDDKLSSQNFGELNNYRHEIN